MPRAGHDGLYAINAEFNTYFNPRAPCGARLLFFSLLFTHKHFNPRAPCGARPNSELEEIDSTLFQSTCPVRGTTIRDGITPIPQRFQSTCPVRGTTISTCGSRKISKFQSTCPVRGTTCSIDVSENPKQFQSTCPVRGTTLEKLSLTCLSVFQSTCPVRGTTKSVKIPDVNQSISIHVPRAGHD